MIASQFVKTIILVKQYHSDIQFISAMSTIKKKNSVIWDRGKGENLYCIYI